MFQIGEVSPQVHVLPFGIRANGARAPQPHTTAFEEAEAVDAQWIQNVLLGLVQQRLEADRQVDHFVSGRLVHRAVDIVASVDARHEATGREINLGSCHWIENCYPGIIERRVSGIDLGAQCPNVRNTLALATVQHRDAIPHSAGVADQEIQNGAGVVTVSGRIVTEG